MFFGIQRRIQRFVRTQHAATDHVNSIAHAKIIDRFVKLFGFIGIRFKERFLIFFAAFDKTCGSHTDRAKR